MASSLYLGDCLEVLRGLDAGSVDAVIADPPYGTTACKWDAVIPFAPLWEALRRVAKPSAAIVLFGGQPFASALVMSNPREFRYDLIWDKVNRCTGALNARRMPMRRHEHLLVFYRRLPVYHPQTRRGVSYDAPKRTGNMGKHLRDQSLQSSGGGSDGTAAQPHSVVSIKGMDRTVEGLHPTQKPVTLLAYLVRTYTNPGDTVLDFCMGSGTTGVACAQEGRDFIGVEREASYYAIAERRLVTTQPPLPMAAD